MMAIDNVCLAHWQWINGSSMWFNSEDMTHPSVWWLQQACGRCKQRHCPDASAFHHLLDVESWISTLTPAWGKSTLTLRIPPGRRVPWPIPQTAQTSLSWSPHHHLAWSVLSSREGRAAASRAEGLRASWHTALLKPLLILHLTQCCITNAGLKHNIVYD